MSRVDRIASLSFQLHHGGGLTHFVGICLWLLERLASRSLNRNDSCVMQRFSQRFQVS